MEPSPVAIAISNLLDNFLAHRGDLPQGGPMGSDDDKSSLMTPKKKKVGGEGQVEEDLDLIVHTAMLQMAMNAYVRQLAIAANHQPEGGEGEPQPPDSGISSPANLDPQDKYI